MLSETIILNAPSGLHARPAGELVKLVKSYPDAKVTLTSNAKQVNAASMLSVLSLGLKFGTEVEVAVEGGDESSILSAVVGFIGSISE